ncbi:YHS domain-containing protein [Thermus scotoductus]|uniref:YHS domain-containing protein n=1 Tax=Thermus scotoductus TaxID=37636 RepID=UPI001C129F1C|nr:YHS domain-containing protein [Thermus scotoductus]
MAQVVRDPVCGMMVDPQKAAGKSVYRDQTYYFCSIGCQKAFDADPERYVKNNDRHPNHNDH